MTVSMALGVFLAWWRQRPSWTVPAGWPSNGRWRTPFTLKALASYVLPAITAARPEALGTDPAMANAFVGLNVLGLALVGLGGRLRGPLAVIAGFGAVAFMASFGDLTPRCMVFSGAGCRASICSGSRPLPVFAMVALFRWRPGA